MRKIGYSKLKNIKKHLKNDIKLIGEDALLYVILKYCNNGTVVYRGYETLSDLKLNESRPFPKLEEDENLTIVSAKDLLKEL